MFTVLHANHLEDLRDLATALSERDPLGPLEDETFLVQSNGMAQWLQLCLAQHHGVAASLDFPLPSSFVWRAYRAVLGDDIPKRSPFDKGPMTWRLMRLLPRLLRQSEFAPLAHYLDDEISLDDQIEGVAPCGERKSYQLASRLADLFDQYLVYRPDWMAAWAQGETAPFDIAPVDHWQPVLWRALLEDASDQAQRHHRAALHDQFLVQARALTSVPKALPRRLFVFGISALPFQLLEALHALSGVMDIVLMVANPCRFYWGDIVADRDALRAQLRRDSHRQRHQAAPSLEGLDSETLHLSANPLLAGWGAQGRDFIEALYDFEADNAFDMEHDIFRDPPTEAYPSLLHQLQQEVLDLVHPARRAEEEGDKRLVQPEDRSLAFTRAHSPLREVEILHDQMLDAFDRDSSLRPRDMVVLVPDIERYAPLIDAVFGQIPRDDARYIPYTVSDRIASGASPLMSAALSLLELPERRLGVSEVLDWLEVPAFRRRFNIEEEELERLSQWLAGSGVRWGLDGEHRDTLDLPGLSENTWQFGLDRMLLGFAIGEGSFDGIQAYDEIGGLEADLAGRLAELMTRLRYWYQHLETPVSIDDWIARLEEMLEALFAPVEQNDFDILERLSRAARTLAEEGECAEFGEVLSLAVFREALTDRLDEGGLAQRFLAGRVNFATLMPMRAIPFRHTWLLGMNDGDYPRVRLPQDFDLMATRHRSGDRSRRDDDRYLMLEAMLATREALTLSWVGRDQRDNSERAPSILVSELLDTLSMGWRVESEDTETALFERLITTHPLQPFARAYFALERGAAPFDRLFTYERGWESVHHPTAIAAIEPLGASPPPEEAASLDDLERLLRRPWSICTAGRLGIHFHPVAVPEEDAEPFALDGLERFSFKRHLLEGACRERDLSEMLEEARRKGMLPALGFGERLAEALIKPLGQQLDQWHELTNGLLPVEAMRVEVLNDAGTTVLSDRLDGLWRDDTGGLHRCVLAPAHFGHFRRDRSGRLTHYGKPHRMIRAWLEHMALTAMGEQVVTTVLFEDRVLVFEAVSLDHARDTLRSLCQQWRKAGDAPLPTALEPAMEYFAGWPRNIDESCESEYREAGLTRAQTCYEEARFNGPAPLREREPMMGELWSRFDDLCEAGFEAATRALYAPFMSAMAALVDGSPIKEPEA
ncbi:exodeoxyribonuclease V subunit gamma [Kushneria marisflavi]|uniref:RecBCD enzyme subunit RecC n=1 Tax=Kushneria marisflavi TaxID=157779 RepID=A0A240UKN8_9GAMM|nr:exodeoxyribonuclease V subunit gamma [Kushneria marisflavi]ART62067.1 exodeoxyribonuclease V subunit gamma [Kushneria marisflavi]RKD87135.1 DNA helicase/exodeoxyribonuclease V gamma subunit [Kushneria marisflavi]